MKRILLLFLILPGLSFAQEFKKTATAGFVFLEIPVTARSAALGEASIALGDLNSDGIFINPGATGFTQQTHSLSASYADWIAEIKHISTSYALKTSVGVFSIGVNAFDFGSMPRTVKIGGQHVYDIRGTFSASALALSAGYSRQLTDRFSFGLALKYANERIDIYSASNLMLDGGILFYTGFGSFRVAAAIQNFGTETSYRTDRFRMPTMFKLGAAMEVYGSYQENYRVTVIAEAIHPNDNNERIN
ncbi:MAG: PorV/PorQ family protein, partial [Ignavibacteriaceae bacterium]|nr:PorV/PorQ family protein [Ignavibacteriaceae bacterium]